MTLSRVPNFASPPTTDTRTQSSSALITRIKQYTIGANTMPIEAKLRARCAASGGMFGIWENCALSAAFVKGSCTTLITMMATARARKGARNRGFSRTRSNTAVGSNNTRTRSRTAPITPSRTKGCLPGPPERRPIYGKSRSLRYAQGRLCAPAARTADPSRLRRSG